MRLLQKTVIVTRTLQLILLEVRKMRLLPLPSHLTQDLPYHRVANLPPWEFFQSSTYLAIKEEIR